MNATGISLCIFASLAVCASGAVASEPDVAVRSEQLRKLHLVSATTGESRPEWKNLPPGSVRTRVDIPAAFMTRNRLVFSSDLTVPGPGDHLWVVRQDPVTRATALGISAELYATVDAARQRLDPPAQGTEMEPLLPDALALGDMSLGVYDPAKGLVTLRFVVDNAVVRAVGPPDQVWDAAHDLVELVRAGNSVPGAPIEFHLDPSVIAQVGKASGFYPPLPRTVDPANLAIELTRPRNGAVISREQQTIVVAGRVAPAADHVTVNGERLPVEKGRFQGAIRTPGLSRQTTIRADLPPDFGSGVPANYDIIVVYRALPGDEYLVDREAVDLRVDEVPGAGPAATPVPAVAGPRPSRPSPAQRRPSPSPTAEP